ncbi:MAG: hypothetical protein KatS3mg119_1451 [Rhodothalassiaceae bacterium]|nr:MAG: hypothetical protein KatS3mg119_1451 [Rhodothalassiaceae bacterium]
MRTLPRHPPARPADPLPSLVIRRLDRRVHSPPSSSAGLTGGSTPLPSSSADLIGGSSGWWRQPLAPGLPSPPHGFAGQAGERRVGKGGTARAHPPSSSAGSTGGSTPLPSSSADLIGGSFSSLVIRRLDRRVHSPPSSSADLIGGSSGWWSPSRALGLPSPPHGFAGQAGERRVGKGGTARAHPPSSSAGSTGGSTPLPRHPPARPAGPLPSLVIRRLDRRIHSPSFVIRRLDRRIQRVVETASCAGAALSASWVRRSSRRTTQKGSVARRCALSTVTRRLDPRVLPPPRHPPASLVAAVDSAGSSPAVAVGAASSILRIVASSRSMVARRSPGIVQSALAAPAV